MTGDLFAGFSLSLLFFPFSSSLRQRGKVALGGRGGGGWGDVCLITCEITGIIVLFLLVSFFFLSVPCHSIATAAWAMLFTYQRTVLEFVTYHPGLWSRSGKPQCHGCWQSCWSREHCEVAIALHEVLLPALSAVPACRQTPLHRWERGEREREKNPKLSNDDQFVEVAAIEQHAPLSMLKYNEVICPPPHPTPPSAPTFPPPHTPTQEYNTTSSSIRAKYDMSTGSVGMTSAICLCIMTCFENRVMCFAQILETMLY